MAKDRKLIPVNPANPNEWRFFDGDQLIYRPHLGQKKALESRAKTVAMLAGTGGGKTTLGPLWLYNEIRERGEGDYLAATATFPLLRLAMLKEFLWLFQKQLNLGRYLKGDKLFEFHDGKTRVIFFSATNPESLESVHAKAAWLDEAGQVQFRRQSWDAVERRLNVNQGRCFITTTLYCLGWLRDEIYIPWQQDDPTIDVIQFDSILNKSFPKEQYERHRQRMPSWKFKMFYQGQFDKPAGLIYDSFNEMVCKTKRVAIPESWPVYTGHDFGAQNAAAMFYAIDPTSGNIFAFAEYFPKEKRTVYEHVDAFKEITQGLRVIKSIGGAHAEEEQRENFTNAGWPILEPRVNAVEVQIDSVYALHKQNKLFVFDDLYTYLDQKTTYSRKLDDNYEPTEAIDDKARYHLMDAERYVLSDFDPKRFGQEERKLAKVVHF